MPHLSVTGVAVDEQAALVGQDDAGHDIEQRALAAAAGPDHADELAVADGQVDAAQRLDGAPLGGERLAQALGLDADLRGSIDRSSFAPQAPLPRHVVGGAMAGTEF